MKKIITVLSSLFIIVQVGFAQNKGGIKGGANFANTILTNQSVLLEESTTKSLTSYHLGCYIQDRISKHFNWQIEMLFSNKGYISEQEGKSVKNNLSYLNWPLLLVYNVSNKIDLLTGIEPGLLIAGEDQYKSFDMGIDVGIDYNYSEKIHAGLRYNHGLPFKMEMNTNEFTGEQPFYQHSVLQIYLGLNIVN